MCHFSFAGTQSTPTQQSSQSQASVQIASQQPQQAQQQQQQQSIMINNYEEPGDDSIVPSTPTLYVPRRADGFSEAVSSPQSHVRISRFDEMSFTLLNLTNLTNLSKFNLKNVASGWTPTDCGAFYICWIGDTNTRRYWRHKNRFDAIGWFWCSECVSNCIAIATWYKQHIGNSTFCGNHWTHCRHECGRRRKRSSSLRTWSWR